MTLSSISVITPSLNQGVFIEDAILSVARQDYPSFEHIVVDGRSTDENVGNPMALGATTAVNLRSFDYVGLKLDGFVAMRRSEPAPLCWHE